MAAVAFTSRRADRARYNAELARERRHVERVPEIETEEIRASFRAKGFDGELLDRIVATITSNKEVWVAIMMADELGLAPSARGSALRAAVVVGVASLVGSALPLLPFALLDVQAAVWASVVVAEVSLF